MKIKVNEDHYTGACEYYASQIEIIEGYLEEFLSEYQALFSSIDFGENLGRVLVGKADSFYGVAKESLTTLMGEATTQTNTFMTDTEYDDKLY